MNTGPLKLSGSEYWNAPLAHEDEVVGELADREMVGLVIDAPSTVTIEERSTVPIVGCHGMTFAEARTLVLEESAVLVGVPLETGVAAASMALAPVDGLVPPEDDGEDPGEGRMYSMFTCDARERLDVAWRPGTWLFTAILRDRVSNRVRTRLRSRAFDGDDEVARLFAEAAGALPTPALWPLPPRQTPGARWVAPILPTYRKLEHSPAVPDEPGVALACERIVVLHDHARVMVAGSFRLPLLAHQICRTPPAPRDPPTMTGEPLHSATAIVPVTLVMTGSENAVPFVIQLGVPTWDAVDAATVTGHFALDLRAFAGFPGRAQKLHLYAFSGEHMLGPKTIALVDERMLPGR